VVSADALCYFGALHAAMAAAQRALRPGGWLIFTVEALIDDAAQGHQLRANGRYAHAADYLRQVIDAAGLELHVLQAETLRHEAGQPVSGWLVTAARP
jgi:predicted TPR repeat methyltransferase